MFRRSRFTSASGERFFRSAVRLGSVRIVVDGVRTILSGEAEGAIRNIYSRQIGRPEADEGLANVGLEKAYRELGSRRAVALYLDSRRVDTPTDIVAELWVRVHERRERVGTVVDFGAGDGRFAAKPNYETHVGLEIDSLRCGRVALPDGAVLLNRCTLSEDIYDADVCSGNAPFVRNQDLRSDWRQHNSSSSSLFADCAFHFHRRNYLAMSVCFSSVKRCELDRSLF